jgi:hypothetical protein
MTFGVYAYSEDVVLERWSIRETEGGARHFVGFSVMNHEGRVSTRIVAFDPESRTGATESGSTYTLVGRAGRDLDAEYVWRRAARAWNVKKWRDVTPELVPDWRLWLSKSERQDLGENEGEFMSYWDLTARPAERNEAFRVDAVRYRASAYTGRHVDMLSASSPISTVTGNGSIEFFRPVPSDRVLQFLVATRVLMEEKLKRAEPIVETPPIWSYLTVVFENLPRADDGSGEQIARFELAMREGEVSGRMVIVNHPELSYGPISFRKRRGIWDAVLRLLPDWGDAGLVSRMDY